MQQQRSKAQRFLCAPCAQRLRSQRCARLWIRPLLPPCAAPSSLLLVALSLVVMCVRTYVLPLLVGVGVGLACGGRMDESVQICAGVSVAGQMIATPQHVLAFENRVAAKVSFSVSLALPCTFSFSLFVSLSFSLSLFPSLSFSLCSINLYM